VAQAITTPDPGRQLTEAAVAQGLATPDPQIMEEAGMAVVQADVPRTPPQTAWRLDVARPLATSVG